MKHLAKSEYFYSIEPYWNSLQILDIRRAPADDFRMFRSHHGAQTLSCVPGNGQVGLELQLTDDGLAGRCYGVLRERGEVLLRGRIEDGGPLYFFSFAPGSFAKICRAPMHTIDPYGTDIRDVFEPEQVEQMQDAIWRDPEGDLLYGLFCRWVSEGELTYITSRNITEEVLRSIWIRRGNITVKELEEITQYSARYLERLITGYVGVTPKQLCSQIRFQHAMHLMRQELVVNHAELALELGFTDQAHYCRVFKKFSGHTPREFNMHHYR